MNANQSLFLNELNQFEGIEIQKVEQPLYTEELDEARHLLIKRATAELDNLHGIDAVKRRDKYGLRQSAWWSEQADKRILLKIKDGTRVLELMPGKSAWILPTPADGCRFLAGLIQAAERKELDRFLSPKPKKKEKTTHYGEHLAALAAQRRANQANDIGVDVDQTVQS